ncbi:hypothetical protein N7470_001105 [Penicillium chermesinum]|nr:hypothetical protein N7470_001105 [Penicillium chermesinum]
MRNPRINQALDAATYKHVPSVEAISRGLANRSKPVSGASVLSIPDITNNRYGEAPQKCYDDVKDASELRDIIHRNSTARAVDEYLLNIPGTKTAIVFPPIIYGKGSGPVNQRSIQIPNLARNALETRQTIQVGKGESIWSNIHIADLAQVFVKLVEKAVTGTEEDLWNHNGLYLVGNSKAITFGQISQLVANAAHKAGLTDSSSVKSVNASEADAVMGKGSIFWGTNAHQSSSRASTLLGWTQKEHSIEEDIPLTVQDEASRLGLHAGSL